MVMDSTIEINNFISSKTAIRGALGNLGMGHLIQSLEEDLLRWAGEANEKITNDTKAATIYEPFEQRGYTKNGRFNLCKGFKAIECLELSGSKIPFELNRERCTSGCKNRCGVSCSCCGPFEGCDTGVKFYLDGNCIKFTPTVADGQEVFVAGYREPQDEEGYILILEKTTTANQDYIAWKICLRMGDNRASSFERNWYFGARQARAWINKKTEQEMREISAWWQPQGFSIGRRFNRRR